MDNFKEPTSYFLPIFILFILLEIYLSYKDKPSLYDYKDSISSLATGVTYLIITAGMKLVAFTLFSFLHQYAIFDIQMNLWYSWLILIIFDDFTFYWFHRMSHQIRVLWASHVNHHSSVQYNFSVALRKSWADSIYKYLFWIWLPIIGFPPLAILAMMSFSLIYQFWTHTQLVGKLGFIELIMNTPSHHRVHHASNAMYLDRNHAGIFIIWDKLFGTFTEETEQPIYGLTNNINSYNIYTISTHEFASLAKDLKQAPSFKTKLNYLLKPPGWTHEGELNTSDAVRKRLNSKS